MLTNIKLENFKCFRELDLKCAPLTLLTGINGTGKSSVFQALMLIRRTFVETLSGRLADDTIYEWLIDDVGSMTEILPEGASHIRIGLDYHAINEGLMRSTLDQLESNHEAKSRKSVELFGCFDLECYFDESGVTPLKQGRFQARNSLDLESEHFLPPFTGEFVLVGAERSGPRTAYPLVVQQNHLTEFGQNSELAWSYLNDHQSSLFDEHDPRVEGGHAQRILDIVNQWLKSISPGANVHLEDFAAVDQLNASYSFDSDSDIPSRPYRATNVGFGLSYTLPIIVALLMSKETLCLIENPEAHLHPSGQTKMAELAARAANAGVQVMVETHSDHFIDGIRIAVREGILTPDDVAIHYFERQGNESVVRSPVIDSDGRLSEWPAGFFDQHEMNLVRLLRPIQGG